MENYDLTDPAIHTQIIKAFVKMCKKCHYDNKKGVVIVPADKELVDLVGWLPNAVSAMIGDRSILETINSRISVIVFGSLGTDSCCIEATKEDLRQHLNRIGADEYTVIGLIPDELTGIIAEHYATGE